MVCDGDAVAAEIEKNAIGAGLRRHKNLSAQLGLPFTQEMLKPSVVLSKVKNVFNDNENVANTWMEERRLYSMRTNVKGSVNSVRSGVKC